MTPDTTHSPAPASFPLVSTANVPTQRAARYAHCFDAIYGVMSRQRAVLGVMLLRGPQTISELHARCERLADFPGAERILKGLIEGPLRVRVGLVVKEGAPAREGAEIADAKGNVIGAITSGGPSPTLGRNIAMGYVPPAFAELGTELKAIVRGKPAAAEVVATPFVATRYYRKPKL